MTALQAAPLSSGSASHLRSRPSRATAVAGRPAHDHRGHGTVPLSAWHCPASFEMVDVVIPNAVAQENHGTVLREFLASNYQRLYQRLLRHLRCPDLASDCLHDAWLRLGEMEVAEPVQNVEAYVYRVACNLAMDVLRSRGRWQSASDVEAELELLADHSPGPDVIAEARSNLAAFERALEHLPRRHRSVLIGLRVEEKTRQEVADWLRISLRSVDTALRQALDHCAAASGQTVAVGVTSSRRGLPRSWLEKAAAEVATGFV
ncbi:sigma-70 family RNA polymerase sigma factor [Bordetella petrii]|nr:RNA polymerase sigma factor [Burkholderiales bacterium]MBO9355676.1 sigma-70 family RNA polymerase sigma factor [Bordetella petrii]